MRACKALNKQRTSKLGSSRLVEVGSFSTKNGVKGFCKVGAWPSFQSSSGALRLLLFEPLPPWPFWPFLPPEPPEKKWKKWYFVDVIFKIYCKKTCFVSDGGNVKTCNLLIRWFHKSRFLISSSRICVNESKFEKKAKIIMYFL